MKLSDQEYNSQRGTEAKTLGMGSALMIASGYNGELTVTGDLTDHWVCLFVSMGFFLYIVQELLVGLSAATNNRDDPSIKANISSAQVWTVISWSTYPVVYLFPMLNIGGSTAVVAVQLGYTVSDIISTCGVGILIY